MLLKGLGNCPILFNADVIFVQNFLLKAYCFTIQVGIVHEAMRFPLWLHGRTIITFLVVSTFPKSPVGKKISTTCCIVLFKT